MSFQTKKKTLPNDYRPMLWLGLWAIAVLLIRVFVRGYPLELDETEQMVFAHYLMPGYPAQAPLYTWLQWAVFQLFGYHLFSLALFKVGLLYGCALIYYRLARLYCQDTLLSWCAVCSLSLIPVIGFDLLKDNTHTTMALFLSLLLQWWLLQRDRMPQILVILSGGFILGFGLLAKFNFIIAVIAGILALFLSIDSKNKLYSVSNVLIIVIAAAICAPYLLWAFNHPDLAFASTRKLSMHSMSLWAGLGALVKVIVVFIAPCFIACVVFFPNLRRPIQSFFNAQDSKYRFLWLYHVIVLVFLGLLLLFGVRAFSARWLIPLFPLMPILLLMPLKERGFSTKRARIYIVFCVCIQGFALLILSIRPLWFLPERMKLPYYEMAQTIKNIPCQNQFMASNSREIMGNLLVYLPSYSPIIWNEVGVFPHYPHRETLFILKDPVSNTLVSKIKHQPHQLIANDIHYACWPGDKTQSN